MDVSSPAVQCSEGSRMVPQTRLRAKVFDSMATFRGLTVIVGCHSLAEQAEQSNIYCWGWIEKQELCACVCVHAWEIGLVYHRAWYEGCQHLLLLPGSPWRRPSSHVHRSRADNTLWLTLELFVFSALLMTDTDIRVIPATFKWEMIHAL